MSKYIECDICHDRTHKGDIFAHCGCCGIDICNKHWGKCEFAPDWDIVTNPYHMLCSKCKVKWMIANYNGHYYACDKELHAQGKV